MVPANAKVKHVEVEKRILSQVEFCEKEAVEIGLNTVEYNSKKIGVITSGITYTYAKEALGENASYLKLGCVYPLPEKLIKDFASSVEKVYVIEELDPIIETHCKNIGVEVVGK